MNAKVEHLQGALADLLGPEGVVLSPDGGLVALPERTVAVSELLRWAARDGIRVRTPHARPAQRGRPFPAPGEVLLKLDRLQGSIVLQEESGIVVVPGGTSGADLAWRLHREGRWLQPRPWPFYDEPIGSYLAGPGLAGEMTALTMWESPLMAIEAVLSDGRTLRAGVAPRSAAGPDYRTFFLGCADRVGVITSATWRTVKRTVPMLAAVRFSADGSGLDLLARYCQGGARPFDSLLLRGGDPDSWRQPRAWTTGGDTVLLCHRAEGDRADLIRGQLAGLVSSFGGEVLDAREARGWYEESFLDTCQRGAAAAGVVEEDGDWLGEAWIAAPWPALGALWNHLAQRSCLVSGEGFRPEGGTLRIRLLRRRGRNLPRARRELAVALRTHGGRLCGMVDHRRRPVEVLAPDSSSVALLEAIADGLGPLRVLNPPDEREGR